MTTWRLLTHDAVGAAEGLALDEGLMAGYRREAPARPATLRLYTYRASAALIGRFQDLDAEVDVEACRRDGAEVGRRLTGGGAIVMGPAQLGVALVTQAPVRLPARSALASFADALGRGLSRLGITAALGGKNDLVADGRKVAGLGLYVDDGGALLLHASVLADLDVEHMLKLLRIPVAKLGGVGSAAVRRRITTVSEQTGRRHDGISLREDVAAGFAQAFGVRCEPGQLDADERIRADGCLARYRSESWLFPPQLARQQRGSALLHTPAGLVRCYLGAQGGVINQVTFVGDMLTMPEALMRLEAALRWSRAEPSLVRRIVEATGAAGELGCPVEALTGLVLEALDTQPDVAASYPARITGSCYFPDPGLALTGQPGSVAELDPVAP